MVTSIFLSELSVCDYELTWPPTEISILSVKHEIKKNFLSKSMLHILKKIYPNYILTWSPATFKKDEFDEMK